jgi:predicted HAD superfamily Cof-like phosphohydrolase
VKGLSAFDSLMDEFAPESPRETAPQPSRLGYREGFRDGDEASR